MRNFRGNGRRDSEYFSPAPRTRPWKSFVADFRTLLGSYCRVEGFGAMFGSTGATLRFDGNGWTSQIALREYAARSTARYRNEIIIGLYTIIFEKVGMGCSVLGGVALILIF